MSKPKLESTQSQTTPEPQTPKRTKVYTFPDIAGGGPAVKIETTSLKEATELFMKGHASNVK